MVAYLPTFTIKTSTKCKYTSPMDPIRLISYCLGNGVIFNGPVVIFFPGAPSDEWRERGDMVSSLNQECSGGISP